MTAEELEDVVATLRALGESADVEVKSNVGKSILETLSAFANGAGGLIVVGLEEKSGFQPVSDFDPQAAQDALITRGEQLTPAVRPFIQILPFEDSLVVAARVAPADERPCYVTARGLYKGSYIRTGEAERPLTRYEVDRLLEEHKQPTWDDEPVERAVLDDLDPHLVKPYLRSQRNQRPRTFQDGEDVAMQRLRILDGDHPTLAAVLAMGVYPQEFFPRLTLSFALVPGTEIGDSSDGLRFEDNATFTGTIPELVEAGVQAVRKNMRTASVVGDVYRKDLPDYPLAAVREALVNAHMHRDYSPEARGSQVQILMFADRLEITNPGGLYGGVTVDNLGQPGVTSSRNQRLSSFLEQLQFEEGGPIAENRGSGIAVIEKALAEVLMPPPEFINTLTHFKVVFRKRRVIAEERHGTAVDQVHDLLGRKESWSTVELVEATGLSRTAVQRAINTLLERGKAQRTEPNRSPRQRYRLA